MPKHPETLLERIRYGAQSWSAVMSANCQRLEDTLLKLSALLDVDVAGLQDGDVIKYNESSGKFERLSYAVYFSTTTTSSTTTSTSP